MDAMVLESQEWYNNTYSGTTWHVPIDEDGIAGAGTTKALVRALQYELGLTPDGVFGNGTLSKCPTIGPNTTNENLVSIIQCGFYCKGYQCFGIDGIFGPYVERAATVFKEDAGFPNSSGELDNTFVKALLNTDSFVLARTGKSYIRTAQQYLNANYIIKTTLIGLIPCNGIADRNMSKAIIIALQYEEAGKKLTGVDGLYGNNTLNKAPELDVKSTKTDYIKIAQMCLMMMMDVNPGLSGTLDIETMAVLKQFQEFYCLTQDSRVTLGVIDRTTWASLLSSKGDSTRTATACDCSEQILSNAKASKLKETYDTVGRYLTGTVGGSKPKNLSLAEIRILTDNGLRIFPIYQDGGASSTYFSENQGIIDAKKAFNAAKNLHIPNGTIIYFAVDYDFTQEQVLAYVVPYFNAISIIFKGLNIKYKIGIYGSRNTCTIVCAQGYAFSSFVSDMSTGYSGNMGYPLPSNWAFDQINEFTAIASDGTSFDVDKNVCSGRNLGFSGDELCGGDMYRDCTNHSMILGEDGYYECGICGYRVPSPFLQDKDALSGNDYLKVQALAALYSITLVDVEHFHCLKSICTKMHEIRNKNAYVGKYAYCDESNKCLLILPDGEYMDNDLYPALQGPTTVTSLNAITYTKFYEDFVDFVYGLAWGNASGTLENIGDGESYSEIIYDIIEGIKNNSDEDITLSLNEILIELANKAEQEAWGYILRLLALGIVLEDDSNSKVVPGDIVVEFVIHTAPLTHAQIVFDSSENLKSVAYK